MPFTFPKCEVVPLPDHQASFRIDGSERLRWHFGPAYPRPFFYPIVGPSGTPLTRMGHPGDPGHDHHRSVWFAHHKVLGIDFWGDNSPARVRQTQWLCYKDGPDEAVMAVRLGWFDGHDPKALLEQELVAAVRSGPDGETFVELQSTFRPTAETLEFGKTNFGFLAVRVAKHLSAHFGGGTITNSAGATGEPAVFAKPALWVDYSGPTAKGGAEGITYFSHPSNPGHPAKWHVREDGWMGAAVCIDGPVTTPRAKPLTLRYLLHAHTGPASAERAKAVLDEFAKRPAFAVVKATVKHQAWDVRRT
ncbi:MAG TPA: PmoA family protein [Gemmataceae bacterium]|nr:PmoA family protein [Gemmataceae bacterium]